jgi:hypothetical protein
MCLTAITAFVCCFCYQPGPLLAWSIVGQPTPPLAASLAALLALCRTAANLLPRCRASRHVFIARHPEEVLVLIALDHAVWSRLVAALRREGGVCVSRERRQVARASSSSSIVTLSTTAEHEEGRAARGRVDVCREEAVRVVDLCWRRVSRRVARRERLRRRRRTRWRRWQRSKPRRCLGIRVPRITTTRSGPMRPLRILDTAEGGRRDVLEAAGRAPHALAQLLDEVVGRCLLLQPAPTPQRVITT